MFTFVSSSSASISVSVCVATLMLLLLMSLLLFGCCYCCYCCCYCYCSVCVVGVEWYGMVWCGSTSQKLACIDLRDKGQSSEDIAILMETSKRNVEKWTSQKVHSSHTYTHTHTYIHTHTHTDPHNLYLLHTSLHFTQLRMRCCNIFALAPTIQNHWFTIVTKQCLSVYFRQLFFFFHAIYIYIYI